MLTSPENLPREALASIGLQPPPDVSKAAAAVQAPGTNPRPLQAEAKGQLPVNSPCTPLAQDGQLSKLAAAVMSSSSPALVNKIPLPPVTKGHPLAGFPKMPISRVVSVVGLQSNHQAGVQNISISPKAPVPLMTPVLSSFPVEMTALSGAHGPATTAALTPAAAVVDVAHSGQQVFSPAQTSTGPTMSQPGELVQMPASVPASFPASLLQPALGSQLAGHSIPATPPTSLLQPALGSQLAGHSTPATSSTVMVDLTGHEYDFDVTDIPTFPDVSDSNSNPFPLQLELDQSATTFSCMPPHALLPPASGSVVSQVPGNRMERQSVQEPLGMGPGRGRSHTLSTPSWS